MHFYGLLRGGLNELHCLHIIIPEVPVIELNLKKIKVKREVLFESMTFRAQYVVKMSFKIPRDTVPGS